MSKSPSANARLSNAGGARAGSALLQRHLFRKFQPCSARAGALFLSGFRVLEVLVQVAAPDRKSTRLNSSHLVISYAVFCLKKKKKFHLTGQTFLNTDSRM